MEILSIIFSYLASAVFGAILGSYATLFAYRIPLGQSCYGRFFGEKSNCPGCKKIIKTKHLIPLVNWFITKGKCDKCGFKIPRSHLFLESLSTIFVVICYHKFGFSDRMVVSSLILVSLLILLVINYKHKCFPNIILNFILILLLVNRAWQGTTLFDFVISVVGGIVFSVFLYNFLTNKNFDKLLINEYIKLTLIVALGVKFGVLVTFFLLIAIIVFSEFLLYNKFDVITDKRKLLINQDKFGLVMISVFVLILLILNI